MIEQLEDWPLQSSSPWSSLFSATFGEHMCGASDVQSYGLLLAIWVRESKIEALCQPQLPLTVQQVKDFSRLYTRKAHVHHYTNFMEREEFDQAFETVNSLIKDYIHLDMLQLGEI